MDKKKIPLLTGKNFQILEATHHGNVWKVTARLGEKTREFEVHGDAENVLQVVSALSKESTKTTPLKDRNIFAISNGKIKDTEVQVEKTNPFVIRIFKKHLQD